MVAYKAHNLSGGVQVPLPQRDLFYKFILIVGSVVRHFTKGLSEVPVSELCSFLKRTQSVMKKGGITRDEQSAFTYSLKYSKIPSTCILTIS